MQTRPYMPVLQMQIQIQKQKHNIRVLTRNQLIQKGISAFPTSKQYKKLANLKQRLYRQQLASNCDGSIVALSGPAISGCIQYYCP